MYTLTVVLLTLVIAWSIAYGVFRLAIYAAAHERDEVRGSGLTASLKDPVAVTLVQAEGEAAPSPGSSSLTSLAVTPAAAARRVAASGVVVVDGQR